MYHTACKAEFQQLIQSVVLTAHVFNFFSKLLLRLMHLVPDSTIIVVVCTSHTLVFGTMTYSNTCMMSLFIPVTWR